jgi:hypothetical protein
MVKASRVAELTQGHSLLGKKRARSQDALEGAGVVIYPLTQRTSVHVVGGSLSVFTSNRGF